MTHLSLFSGIGGFELAAEAVGFRTVGQVEIDDYCNRVLEYYWPDVPRWRDVKDVTAESFERRTGIKPGTLAVLSGGFPCQPFSAAGKRRGESDNRYLWPEMLRVICEIRPRWIVAENVRGILSIDTGRTFGRILSNLAENGYRVGWLCYGASDVGAPHRRERVFIVAHSESIGRRGWSNGDEGGRSGEIQTSRSCSPEERAYMAHTPQHLFNRPRQTRETGRGEFADGGNVADPDVMHREKCRPLGRMGREGEPDQGDGRGQGPTQSGMGRNFDGLPAGLAGYRWPAGPGPQYPWEPPRIATGVKDRVAKLKALGNAVVPAQAYPIFRAIMGIEDAEKRHSLE
jgi:DNA (cytosine-5)-methyltransferase 1